MNYRSRIRKKFDWNLAGKFSKPQQKVIWDAGCLLRAYLDRNTGRHGKAWLKKNLGRVNFHLGGLPQKIVTAANHKKPTSVTFLANGIWLEPTFEQGGNPIQHVIHEVAHVVDNRCGRHHFALLSIWFGHGPADALVRFLGGRPRGLRWRNGTCRIRQSLRWPSNDFITQYGYGNHSSADYFAEAFAWSVVDPSKIFQPLVGKWMNAFIRKSQ
jgi:hypothetical protein